MANRCVSFLGLAVRGRCWRILASKRLRKRNWDWPILPVFRPQTRATKFSGWRRCETQSKRRSSQPGFLYVKRCGEFGGTAGERSPAKPTWSILLVFGVSTRRDCLNKNIHPVWGWWPACRKICPSKPERDHLWWVGAVARPVPYKRSGAPKRIRLGTVMLLFPPYKSCDRRERVNGIGRHFSNAHAAGSAKIGRKLSTC